MTKLMKLGLKLTSVETSYGEIIGIREDVVIQTEIPVELANRIKALLREDDTFLVSIVGQSGEYDGYWPEE